MADRQVWLRAGLGAGVVAAGVGAALVAGPGLAAASTDDGADRGTVSAAEDRNSTAPARSRGSAKRASTPPAAGPARPAASRPAGTAATVSPASAQDSVKAIAAEAVSRPARGPLPGVTRSAAAGTRSAGPAVGAVVQTTTSAPAPAVTGAGAAANVGTIALTANVAPANVVPANVVPAKATTATTATTAKAAVAADPGPIQAAIIAAQAYIYGYPLMEYQRVRQVVGTTNTLYSLTSFANPDIDPIWFAIGGGKRPNTDTFYSLAELDLSNGPVVLSIPDMGDRYFSFQLTDPYTNVSGYVGSRTTGSGPGQYAITWTGGPRVDVPGAQTVLVPYSSMLALGRTLAGDEADQQTAIELMKQYALNPSGGTVSPVIPIPRPGLGYLDAISAAMELNPPPAIDDPQLAAMARIGVGPGMRVADANLGLLSTIAADLAVRTTAALLPLLATLTQYATAFQSRGWATPDPAIGNYGTDYLLRAGVAEKGLVANTPEEAVYSAGLLSANLIPLLGYGTGSYVLSFAPGEQPPVDAFWSVTVYDSAGRLVPSAQDRFSVSSSRPDELVYRPDGSIDIVFSPRNPGDPGANWLKVPAGGGFSVYLRMYVPQQSVLDGSWVPPAIERRWWWS